MFSEGMLIMKGRLERINEDDGDLGKEIEEFSKRDNREKAISVVDMYLKSEAIRGGVREKVYGGEGEVQHEPEIKSTPGRETKKKPVVKKVAGKSPAPKSKDKPAPKSKEKPVPKDKGKPPVKKKTVAKKK